MQEYEVGTYRDLKRCGKVEDGYDIHHLIKKQIGQLFIPAYNENEAVCIVLKGKDHRRLYPEISTKPGEAGSYSGGSRIDSGLATVIEQVQAQDDQSFNTPPESLRIDSDGDGPPPTLQRAPGHGAAGVCPGGGASGRK